MTTLHRGWPRHEAPAWLRCAAISSLALLLLIATPAGFSSPGSSPEDSGLRLGLVERAPVPGAAEIPLELAVAQVRHDYGRFLLARFTTEQERALREAGYAVRVFEDPERVGLGFYSFRVPSGPVNLPVDLTVDESRFAVGTYLVKMIGPARDEWLSEIRALGGEILTPVPEFTYLVRMPPWQRARIAALRFVEWVGAYHPAFKLSGELARRNQEGTLPDGLMKLNVLVYRSADLEGAVNRIRGMGGEILNRMPAYFSEMETVLVAGTKVPDLARLADVYAVEVAPEPELDDESATQILAGQVDANGIPFRPYYGLPTYNDWLAERDLDGSNVTIGYVDNGVLNDDPSGHTSGRVNESVCGTAGSDGHGQFGASIAGGVCSDVPEPETGYLYGQGMATGVNFINIPFLKLSGECTDDDATRARDTVAYTGPNGAPGTIQNNSWGSGGRSSDGNTIEDVSYTALEQIFDALVRDADSVAPGNQPLTTCFSIGNEGNTTPGSSGDSPSSMTRPKAAKNVITTGSSSVYRPSVGGTNINDRSLFSSQGPTLDGRIKPDFMAPGGVAATVVALASARVNSYGSDLDGIHSLWAGTSFSSPATAGGAALLSQWWQRFASATPSPAMLKALLVNSARDMQDGNTADTIPNRHEGWGRWNLGNVLEPGTPTIVSAPPLYWKTSGLGALYMDQEVVFGSVGEQYQVRFVPSDPGQPVRATLVWTDAPGAVGSCPSLVNDLDLELVQNGKVVLRGNAFMNGVTAAGGPADHGDNVEQVIQPSPSGLYTLTVKAMAVAGDGIPGNGDTTDQDFALVVTNAVPYSGPILSAGTPSFQDICSGPGAGDNAVIDPGETVVFSVPLANSGDVEATAVTGSVASLTPGVTVLDGLAAYDDIQAGGAADPMAGDTLSLYVAGTVPCGSGIEMVLNVATGQGAFAVPIRFDVGSRTFSTDILSGTTGQVIDDVLNPSIFTTPTAPAGVIRNISLDIDLASEDASYLFDNYEIILTSPQGTGVSVHNNPLPCMSLNTTFPQNRLPQPGSLDLYQGQNAAGNWTLTVYDRNNSVGDLCGLPGGQPCSKGYLNSWAVHITRESTPACMTCGLLYPPEVSPPGSAAPLLLDLDTSTGVVTFTWEEQGSLADSYRLYQGLTGSLQAWGGATASNTFTVQCGIPGPTTTFLPVEGNFFYLVAAQKGELIGPLGEATDPVMHPRSADQACP